MAWRNPGNGGRDDGAAFAAFPDFAALNPGCTSCLTLKPALINDVIMLRTSA
jgi:hypothetical protein